MAQIRQTFRDHIYVLCYAGVVLAVLLPLLKPGFILTLDLVFTPHIAMPATVSSSYLLHVVLHLLNCILPGDVIEKLLLLSAFTLSGLGMHRLVQYLSRERNSMPDAAAIVAGVLYMINPFTYDRLMAGQYNVLLGYALLPFLAQSLFLFLDRPALGRSVRLGGLMTVIGIVSIHTLGLVALLVCAGMGAALWRRQEWAYVRQLGVWGAAAVLLFAIASAYWLVPLLAGKGTTADTIASFTAGDNSTFSTVGGDFTGRLANILRLQGFWAEQRDMYILPQDDVPLWGLLAIMLWALTVIGARHWWRHGRQREVACLLTAMALAAVAATGSLQNLALHLPVLAGYREPEKFVGLLALGYGVLAAGGAGPVIMYCRRVGGRAIQTGASIVLVLLPIVFTPTILWACNHQLTAAAYPADWFTADRLLNRDTSSFQTLFLPWHLYMYFGFAGRIIANPAPTFFTKPALVSDNPEFGSAAPAGTTAAKRQLDALLPAAATDTQLGPRLTRLHIKYILLDKDNDYQKYDYLNQQPDLRLVWQGPTIELYRNVSYGGTS